MKVNIDHKKPSCNNPFSKDKSVSENDLIRCAKCTKYLRQKSQQLHSKLCKIKFLIPTQNSLNSKTFKFSGMMDMDSILSINNNICIVKDIYDNKDFSITLDKHRSKEGVFLIQLHQTIFDPSLRIKLLFNFGNFKIFTKELSLQRKVGKLVIPKKCTHRIVKFKAFVRK